MKAKARKIMSAFSSGFHILITSRKDERVPYIYFSKPAVSATEIPALIYG